jgi:hypothetical protein
LPPVPTSTHSPIGLFALMRQTFLVGGGGLGWDMEACL